MQVTKVTRLVSAILGAGRSRWAACCAAALVNAALLVAGGPALADAAPVSGVTRVADGASTTTVSARTVTKGVGPIMPVTSCASLAKMNFRDGPGVSAVLTSARVVKVKVWATKVAFCDVVGVIAPQTRFEIQLPTATWHGQYIQNGCEVYCGAIPSGEMPTAGLSCAAAQNGEFVLAADDEGHTGLGTDGSWAKNSLALRVVYGLTSEHSVAQVARSIIRAYYGRPATYRYYDGCSTGGREALILAQRYPGDFNGIIAGAPAMNLAPLSGLMDAWLVISNTGPDGREIVTAASVRTLHAAVMKACAGSGGIIEDPRRCGFNPASIQCPPREHASTCLTPAQVEAVRKFYRGPSDPAGQNLYNGGEPYGSELYWIGEFVQPASSGSQPVADSGTAKLALNYLKYLAFMPNPPADFTLADLRFTAQEFWALNRLGNAIYNANDPDLQAFAARGGKLIMYHGWADQAIPPWSTLDYYAALERAAGGFRASQTFSRLYMIPGAYHCLYSPDYRYANLADFLTPLVAWVQRGIAPGSVQADTWDTGTNTYTSREVVRPFDALAPVRPANGSLNAGYRYIGRY